MISCKNCGFEHKICIGSGWTSLSAQKIADNPLRVISFFCNYLFDYFNSGELVWHRNLLNTLVEWLKDKQFQYQSQPEPKTKYLSQSDMLGYLEDALHGYNQKYELKYGVSIENLIEQIEEIYAKEEQKLHEEMCYTKERLLDDELSGDIRALFDKNGGAIDTFEDVGFHECIGDLYCPDCGVILYKPHFRFKHPDGEYISQYHCSCGAMMKRFKMILPSFELGYNSLPGSDDDDSPPYVGKGEWDAENIKFIDENETIFIPKCSECGSEKGFTLTNESFFEVY
jgi:hypothetical protein